jgi:hypothetical protein
MLMSKLSLLPLGSIDAVLSACAKDVNEQNTSAAASRLLK